MDRRTVHCFVFLSFLWGTFALKFSDVVHSHHGQMRGLRLKTISAGKEYLAFKRIPYAKPPLGEQRFKAPEQPEPWKGVLDATQEGPQCLQYDQISGLLSGGEDCLYANVYTPITNLNNLSSHDLKPVMVWIHGVFYVKGSANHTLYGVDYLIEDDVVVVTFNYRLGPLGFLTTDDPEVPGNAGLKDQNLLLKWVQKNIPHFGGDPNSVTIFGQCAGGVSVDLHMLSSSSRGLFHRSISMSGSVMNAWAIVPNWQAKSRAFQIGSKLGYKGHNSKELVSFLRKVSPYDLVNSSAIGYLDTVFQPTIEEGNENETFLAENPITMLQSGNFTKLPHMCGYVPRETLFFLQPMKSLPTVVNKVFVAINNMYKQIEEQSDLVPTALKTAFLQIMNNFADVTTDLSFIAGIDLKQRIMAKHMQEGLWYYLYSFDSKYSVHRSLFDLYFIGTGHLDDLGSIFYTTLANVTTDPRDEYNVVRKRTTRLWTNFAKYGNPTPVRESELQNVVWPDSKSSGQQLKISNDLKVIDRDVRPRVVIFEVLTYILLPLYQCCANFISKLNFCL